MEFFLRLRSQSAATCLALGLLLSGSASADSLTLQRLSRLGGVIQKVWGVSLHCRPHLLAASDSDLIVIDATDSTRTLELGRIELGDEPVDLGFDGRVAHILLAGGGWRTVDLVNPHHPEVTGAAEILSGYSAVAGIGLHSFLVSPDSGFHVLERTGPSIHIRRFLAGKPGEVRRLFIKGNHLYAATDAMGILIFDLTEPGHPVKVGEIPISALDMAVSAQGNHAYVLDRNYVVRVYDFSDPRSPAYVRTYDGGNSGSVTRMVLQRNRMYLAYSITGLIVLDVSDPAMPSKIGEVPVIKDLPNGFPIGAGSIGLLIPDSSLEIYDVMDAAYFKKIGSHTMGGRGLKVEKNHLFLAAGMQFIIADLGQPSHPVPVGSLPTPGTSLEVNLEGNRAWVLERNDSNFTYLDGGLMVADISDPTSPQYVRRYKGFFRVDQDMVLDVNSQRVMLARDGVLLTPTGSCVNSNWGAVGN